MTGSLAALAEARTLSSGLPVGQFGFGAMQLTGPKVWGDFPNRPHAIELLQAVVAQGVRFIDTADVYGPHSNEVLIREALHPYPADLLVATKGGNVRGGSDYSTLSAVGNRQYLRQAAFMSARRLGVDVIDLYYLHSAAATDVPFEEQVETLAQLQQEGVIRRIGLSNLTIDQYRLATTIVRIDAVTAQFNVDVRPGAALMAAAEQDGVVFSPWHPTGESAPRTSEVLDVLAERHGVTTRQIALAWHLHRCSVALPIPSGTEIAHVTENLAATRIRLTDDEMHAINAMAPEAY